MQDGLIYFKAFLVSLLEGLTEFIPVSSTGHMILFSKLIDFNHPIVDSFIIFIQLGAICAVFGIYFRQYMSVVSGLFQSGGFRKALLRNEFPSATHFALAIFPIGLIGFIFYPIIREYLFSVYPVFFGLFFGGLAMILTDRFAPEPKVREVSGISLWQAFGIGMGQVFALWPGVSRSGSTMITSLFLKTDYRPAADFSFMIAAPVMFPAVIYELWKNTDSIQLEEIKLLSFGFLAAFIISFFSIRWFLKLLPKWKLAPFGIYRMILASVFMIYFFFLR